MSLELNLNRRTIITAAGDYKNFDISSVSIGFKHLNNTQEATFLYAPLRQFPHSHFY